MRILYHTRGILSIFFRTIETEKGKPDEERAEGFLQKRRGQGCGERCAEGRKRQRGQNDPPHPLGLQKSVFRVRFEGDGAHGEKGKEVGALGNFLLHTAHEDEKGDGDGAATHTHTCGDPA